MSKKEQLQKLYSKIELNSTNERQLLTKIKSGRATDDELNMLLDTIRAQKDGGRILEDIIAFEKALIPDFNTQIITLDSLHDKYFDAAHIEDEEKLNHKMAEIEKRYKNELQKTEDILDAMRIAYFQIDNFDEYYDRFYSIKEQFGHWE